MEARDSTCSRQGFCGEFGDDHPALGSTVY